MGLLEAVVWALASQSAGITGVSHCARLAEKISKFLSRLYENHKIMKERERELAK